MWHTGTYVMSMEVDADREVEPRRRRKRAGVCSTRLVEETGSSDDDAEAELVLAEIQRERKANGKRKQTAGRKKVKRPKPSKGATHSGPPRRPPSWTLL